MTESVHDSIIARIHREIPRLAEALSSAPHEAATLLRNWVANFVPCTGDDTLTLRAADPGYKYLPIAEQYAYFASGRVGVRCGGYAAFCSLLFQLFGFDAAVYNAGVRGLFTHVVSLVSLPSGRGQDIYVHDPLFNLEYRDSVDGEALCFGELLRRDKENEFDRIAVVALPAPRRLQLRQRGSKVGDLPFDFYRQSTFAANLQQELCVLRPEHTLVRLFRWRLSWHYFDSPSNNQKLLSSLEQFTRKSLRTASEAEFSAEPLASRRAFSYHAALIRLDVPRLIEGKQYSQAQDALTRLVKEHPDSVEIVYWLGRMYREADDPVAAEAAYRRQLAMHACEQEQCFLISTHFHLAQLLIAGGRSEEAAHHFQECVNLNPGHRGAQQGLNHCRMAS